MSPPAPRASRRLPREKGWQPFQHRLRLCPGPPPTRRRRAMPRGGELRWETTFETEFAMFGVCVSQCCEGSGGQRPRCHPGAAPVPSAPDLSKRAQHPPAMLGRGVSPPNQPSPPKPGPGSSVGLSCVNYKIVLLRACLWL